MENTNTNQVISENQEIAFKCLHYSVTESAGSVNITLKKKTDAELTFGVRTRDGSAKGGQEEK